MEKGRVERGTEGGENKVKALALGGATDGWVRRLAERSGVEVAGSGRARGWHEAQGSAFQMM